MRTVLATNGKCELGNRATKAQVGRTPTAVIFGLILAFSTCLSATALAQDPGPGDPGDNPGPTAAPPVIEDFGVTYLETGPDVWEYTFVGRVVSPQNVDGLTVEIMGGPFSAVVTTNPLGQFEAILTITGGPAIGIEVSAFVSENGFPVSQTATIDL